MLYLLESEGFYMSNNVKEEVKTEVKEEQAEEVKDINSLLPGALPIEKPTAETPAYEDSIEEARLAFTKKFKTGRRNSYIVMGVLVLFAIGSVVCIGMKGMAWKIAGWSLVGTALVGMLLYYILTRNNIPNATKEYIEVVNKQLNMRNYADNRFTDVSTDKNEKIELADPISDAVFKDLNHIASRNVINGHFAGRTFKVADLGVYSGQGRSRTSAFVGKYISYPNDLHFEGRYILVSKGVAPVDLPSDIEDLVVLQEEDNFVIYGKEGNKPASDLGKEFISALKKIRVEKHLLNIDCVIWGGHSSIYASYDDKIMTLPYQETYDKEPNEQFANDLVNYFEALSLLVKKEK